jgi:hypothetical protein
MQARLTASKQKAASAEGDAMNVDESDETASEELTRLQVCTSIYYMY